MLDDEMNLSWWCEHPQNGRKEKDNNPPQGTKHFHREPTDIAHEVKWKNSKGIIDGVLLVAFQLRVPFLPRLTFYVGYRI